MSTPKDISAQVASDTAAGKAALREVFKLSARRMGKTAAMEAAEGVSTAAAPSASPYVLDVDRWGARRGKELAETWRELESTPAGDEAEDYMAVQNAPPAHEPTLAADAHEALFSPESSFTERPADTSRAQWFKDLMDTDEFRRLHQQTALNTSLAAIGAKSLADQWREYVIENPPPEDGEPQPGSPEESFGSALARARSTAEALKAASEDVQTAQDLSAGLGMGDPGGEIDPKLLATYFQRVRSDDFLRRLMQMAGRMRRLCQSLQRTKTQHGRDDMVGIELGGDLSRLVPSELANLVCGVPELELLTLDRVARKQALCRQYRAVEPLGRGPIVVVVDESGSMRGEPVMTAKAIALALAWLAREQRRWIAFVGFAGGTEGTRVAFPPGRRDEEALIDWLTHFYAGGTTLDVPLQQLPEVYWPEFVRNGVARGRTDVVLITDAVVNCPDAMRDKYVTWAKAEQVKTYGIVIGQEDPGVLAEICYRHWTVPALGADTRAVQEVLSI